MALQAICIYRPCWVDASGQRVLGHDEDETTAAIVALRGLPATPRRVVFVSQAPEFIEGDTAVVAAAGIDDTTVAVERRLGGPDAVLDAIISAHAGTAVVAVHADAPAAAAAALIGDAGAALIDAGAVARSLPLRMRAIGDAEASVYDDPRLMRERGWRPATEALGGDMPTVIVGVPKNYARSVRAQGEDVQGPAAAIIGLASVIESRASGRLIAVNGASARAVDMTDVTGCTVIEIARDPVPIGKTTVDHSVEIPISLAAYERAFDAKLSLAASVCRCGAVEFPPRPWCSECGQPSGDARRALPRQGAIYSAVTVRIAVPGMRSPYSIAIVDLDGVDLRVMAPITDVPAGSAAIGDRGSLVLRRMALRRGVPDYGYAFQPEGPAP